MNELEHRIMLNIAEDCRELRREVGGVNKEYVAHLESLILNMQETIKSLIDLKNE